jgi:sirohydrochlorin ferrochelatase
VASPRISALHHRGSAVQQPQHDISGPVPALPLDNSPPGAAASVASAAEGLQALQHGASAGEYPATRATELDTAPVAGGSKQQQQQQSDAQQQAATAFEAAAASAAAAVAAEERSGRTPGGQLWLLQAPTWLLPAYMCTPKVSGLQTCQPFTSFQQVDV